MSVRKIIQVVFLMFPVCKWLTEKTEEGKSLFTRGISPLFACGKNRTCNLYFCCGVSPPVTNVAGVLHGDLPH